MNETLDKLLKQIFETDEVTDDMQICDLDSLAKAELIVELEIIFRKHFDNQMIKSLKTVKDVKGLDFND